MLHNQELQDRDLDAGFVVRLGEFLRRPTITVSNGLDSMRMTALGAWAANELGRQGADSVEILWQHGDPAIQVSASFDGEGVFSVRSETQPKRDRAVMAAVSRIIDDRVEAWNHARFGFSSSESWWRVLEVSPQAGVADVRQAYRLKAMETHPDRGGSHDGMARLNRAMDDAERMLN